MASFQENGNIRNFQEFVKEVYFLPNDRDYELSEMLNNIQRHAMRGIKGIRQGNLEKTKTNALISLSWFSSTMSRLHINVEDAVWQRFPYLCSYCGKTPCECKKNAMPGRKKVIIDESKRPKSMREFQEMFNKIYPASARTLEIAGLHLAEELGELSEAVWTFRGERRYCDLEIAVKEAADYYSTVMSVFNSLNVDAATELSKLFFNNCHVCHKTPCECPYRFVRRFK